MLTLADAARHAGTSKSSLFRWIKSGRVSATKADDGTYRVDPAELQRYLNSVSAEAHRERGAEQSEAAPGVSADAATLRERNATLEAEIAGLKALLETERRHADELRRNGEAWREQAQRLALSPPQPAPVLVTEPPGFWRRIFAR